jgi:hypothetical protein
MELDSIPLSSSSASQDQAIRLQDHTYCTSLAKTSMVSRTSASVLCQASKTSFQTRSSVSVQGKSGTSKARVSSSSRLATLREGLPQNGFSVVSKSVRESTGIVYEAKWAIFCDWCSGRNSDPVRVTVQQLADFLKGSFRGLAQDRSRSSGNHACFGQAGAIRMTLQSDCLILRST